MVLCHFDLAILPKANLEIQIVKTKAKYSNGIWKKININGRYILYNSGILQYFQQQFETQLCYEGSGDSQINLDKHSDQRKNCNCICSSVAQSWSWNSQIPKKKLLSWKVQTQTWTWSQIATSDIWGISKSLLNASKATKFRCWVGTRAVPW